MKITAQSHKSILQKWNEIKAIALVKRCGRALTAQSAQEALDKFASFFERLKKSAFVFF